jgi:hypothetical protein
MEQGHGAGAVGQGQWDRGRDWGPSTLGIAEAWVGVAREAEPVVRHWKRGVRCALYTAFSGRVS